MTFLEHHKNFDFQSIVTLWYLDQFIVTILFQWFILLDINARLDQIEEQLEDIADRVGDLEQTG